MQAEPPQLGKLEIKLYQARDLKGPDVLGKKDCYVVFTFGEKRVSSSVKEGTTEPVWNEEFEIDNVPYPPKTKVAITVVYKGNKYKDEVLGVTAPSVRLWTTGTNPRKDQWLDIGDMHAYYMGKVQFHIHWTKHESPKLEPPKLESPKLKPPYSQVFKSIDPVLLGVHAGLLL